MMQVDLFDEYFLKSQKLACQAPRSESAHRTLLELIDQTSHQNQDAALGLFLKGERAFYYHNYKNALQFYLQAQSIPYFKLFCYRASAYVARETQDPTKAIGFAQKALGLHADDYPSLTLLSQLLQETDQTEAAQDAQTKLALLDDRYRSAEPEEQAVEIQPVQPAPLNSSTAANDLMQRLYSNDTQAPYLPTRDELETLVQSFPTSQQPRHHALPVEPLTHSIYADEELELAIATFAGKHAQRVNDYLESYRTRMPLSSHSLYVLHGWQEEAQESACPTQLTEQSRRTSGGFYLRWEGKGIVINPGRHFLQNFHRQGLHIRDIDYVIVTGDHPDCYADVAEIYALNHQLNTELPDLQIIHYYLGQKSYEALSGLLKPNFKQERNTTHCLELFLDSPDLEHTELEQGIVLNYFPLAPTSPCLGFTLQLKSLTDVNTLRIGYTSGGAWSPLLSHHLGGCDLLIAGFGHTSPDDYRKKSYLEDCLGYHGTYSLMDVVHPRLLICSEFDGREGDIRLEVVRLLRQQYAQEHPDITAPTVLPADTRLCIDLKTLQVQCTTTKALIDAARVRIIKTASRFGHLDYICPGCSL